MPKTLPEHFQSYTYKLHIQNTSNLIHTNFTHSRTLPNLIFTYRTNLIHAHVEPIFQTSLNHSNLINTNCPTSNLIHTNFMHFQSYTYKLHIKNIPILYIQTSHTEHLQSYTYKLHIQNTSNLIHTNFT